MLSKVKKVFIGKNLTIGSTAGTYGFTTSVISGAVTFTDTGDLVGKTNHGLVSGTPIQFSSVTTTTGVSANTTYYVITPLVDSFQISTTVGGSAVALTTDGTGVLAPSYTTVAAGSVWLVGSDKKTTLTASSAATNATIYVVEATSETNSITNELGTVFASVRKLIFSDPITASTVRSVTAKVAVAKTEQVVTISSPLLVGTATAVGKEYVLRLVYKDVKEHPGQKTQTYRIVGDATTTATATTLFDKFRSLINKDGGARVTASGTSTLILTAKAIPECTTSINDIDEFRMVNFQSFFYYLDPSASVTNRYLAGTITATTASNAGKGTWEQVRDAEKAVQGQQFGITNRIHFPVRKPELRTEKVAYDSITIEHFNSYKSPDNGYTKNAEVTTQMFFEHATTSASSAKSGLSVGFTNLQGHLEAGKGVADLLDAWLTQFRPEFATAVLDVLA
jgi:hypothetical protein